jgi:GNAT superfamily N-acetyltransferase/N-acetylglutamate synthase-like GNAT family acetyltransferase
MDSFRYRLCREADFEMLRFALRDESWNRLSKLLQSSCTRPDWIILGFEGGALIGILALAAPGDRELPIEIIPLRFPRGHQDFARTLFESAIEKARALGACELFCYELEDVDAAFLPNLGFRQWRTTVRFDSAVDPGKRTSSLRFAPVSDFARQAIVTLIAQVSERSADMQIQYYRDRLGERGDAEMTLQIMESTRYNQSWWRIALHTDGQPIGIILPVIAFGEPTIGFVGVSATHRGRGFGAALLSEARSVMTHHGYQTLLAETDARNFSMHRALLNSGFTRRWQKQDWRIVMAGGRLF